jgi:radical SAM/Cys-rich protein
LASKLAEGALQLRRAKPEILQINVGKLCNLTCTHCHVNAGPKRKEMMTREPATALSIGSPRRKFRLSISRGAPEMFPDFRHLILRLRALRQRRCILERCNLTILLELGYDGLAEFLAENEVEIIASMPCYSPENVNSQRGEGVFRRQYHRAATTERARHRQSPG